MDRLAEDRKRSDLDALAKNIAWEVGNVESLTRQLDMATRQLDRATDLYVERENRP